MSHENKYNDVQTFVNEKGMICKRFLLDGVTVEVTPATLGKIINAKKFCRTEHDFLLTLLNQCTRFDGKKRLKKEIEALPLPHFFKIQTVFTSITFK